VSGQPPQDGARRWKLCYPPPGGREMCAGVHVSRGTSQRNAICHSLVRAFQASPLRNRLVQLEGRGSRVEDPARSSIHRRIKKASPSDRLGILLNQTAQYVPLRFFGTIEGWADASAHDHFAIFDAIETGDADAARAAMSAHIAHVGELLLKHLRMHRGDSRPD
jgi:DNA-binding FadR family transcriptional regulator